MSVFTIKISISIEQINDYVKRISDNPYVTIEHDGILIDKRLMDQIELSKNAFIDDHSDLKKIYDMQIQKETIADPLSRSAVDLTMFASLPPQPYPSWILSDNTSKWIPPVEYPDNTGDGLNITYIWNEEELQFDRKPPETPQPFASWVPNETSTDWIPPKAYPDGTGEGYNKLYRWNEETLTWQDILV